MPDLIVTREGLRLFGYLLNWFGVALVAATWAGIEASARLAKRDRRTPEHVWRAAVWIIPLAFIGARLWFVLFPPESVVALGRDAGWMLTHFLDLNQGAIAVWSGGLGLIGGVMGAVVGVWLYARRFKQPIWPWLDIGAIGLSLAQAIGRWGEGANQEIYGPPTSLRWGVLIDDPARRVGMYADVARFPLDSTRFHPVWLYESMLSALICVVLLFVFLRRDRLPQSQKVYGQIAGLYLILYGAGRFILEFIRVNVSTVAGVNVSQLAMVGAIVLGSRIQQRRADVNRA
jgi:phosphatidylglycerol:prolipoprotein diacylglycerol transferase